MHDIPSTIKLCLSSLCFPPLKPDNVSTESLEIHSSTLEKGLSQVKQHAPVVPAIQEAKQKSLSKQVHDQPEQHSEALQRESKSERASERERGRKRKREREKREREIKKEEGKERKKKGGRQADILHLNLVCSQFHFFK